MTRVDVYHGDSRELLRMMPANSVDAVVCDAPYGLSDAQPDVAAVLAAWLAGGEFQASGPGFMGKAWDSFVPGPPVWRECLRVLKPGGHLVSFFGTRTYDLGAIAIRLAGFEVRDMVAWLYGSGFPKSLNVAKAIDAADAPVAARERALAFTAWMRSTGATSATLNALTGTVMASHFLTDKQQPEVATREHFERMRPALGEVPAWVEDMVTQRTVESEDSKRREVVGHHASPAQAQEWRAKYEGGAVREAGAITRSFTADAQDWEGWGTALKPALEPVVLARKPLAGTVARNVLAYGTGALNVGACRVQTGELIPVMKSTGGRKFEQRHTQEDRVNRAVGSHDLGRWPANLVHDGSADVLGAFPTDGDSGSAARFFYSAKADAEDRLGSEHPTVKPVDLMAWLVRLTCRGGGLVLDPFAGTGTTGLACLREGVDAVLIERDEASVADIRRRLNWAQGAGRLTDQEKLGKRLDPAKASGAGTPLFGDGDGSSGGVNDRRTGET